jgi:hypothetical protein
MTENDTPETREQRYQRQTKESFEYVGRFVQAFELMVGRVHSGVLNLTSNGPKHQRLINIIFNGMAANTLFATWRSLLAEIVNDPHYKVDKETRLLTMKILSQAAEEYQALLTLRNDMLHGRWHIGWASQSDEDFSEIKVTKFKSTAKGFQTAPTPSTIDEIKSIIGRCDELGRNISALDMCLTTPGVGSLASNFSKVNGKWVAASNFS